MTVNRALATVVCWGLGLGVLGALGGAAIGALAPGYYRTVFPFAGPQLDPVQTGIGLGATQGLGVGMVLSLVVLALFAWRDRVPLVTEPTTQPAPGRRWRFMAVILVCVFTTPFCTLVALLLGLFFGNQQIYANWRAEKERRIETVLETGEFPNLTLVGSSWSHVGLRGMVPSQRALDTLRDKLVRAVGTDDAEDVIRTVEVAR
jgi:hypothetical protein